MSDLFPGDLSAFDDLNRLGQQQRIHIARRNGVFQVLGFPAMQEQKTIENFLFGDRIGREVSHQMRSRPNLVLLSSSDKYPMRYRELLEAQRIARNPLKLPASQPSQNDLFHGTPMSHLGLIVKSNRLFQGGHWSKPGEPHGVRCTRSLNAAESFAFEQEFPGGILVLDWPKIAQRYKTIPYIDSQYNNVDPSQPGEPWGADEAEEVILTAALQPLSDYLKHILLQREVLTALRAGEYLKDEWTEGFAAYDGRPLYVHRRGIQALMAYPRLRAV